MKKKRNLFSAIPAMLVFALVLPVLAEIPVFSVQEDPSGYENAYIQDGQLVTNLNFPNERGVIAKYTGIDLGEAPKEVRCKARFYGGGAVALVTTPSDSWSVEGITDRSIHAVFTSNSYHFGFFENGQLADVLSGSYDLDVTGKKEYDFGFTISKNNITFLLPTGKKVRKTDDERVKACNGPYVFFEHYMTPEDAAIGAAPAITYVYAKGAKTPALKDDFNRTGGLPLTAPTGHVYVQFRNE